MGQMKLSSAVIAAMVAAFVLAACGGDDSPEQPIVIPTESSTTGSLDKEDFIAEADAICAEANAAINEFADAGQGLTAASEIAASTPMPVARSTTRPTTIVAGSRTSVTGAAVSHRSVQRVRRVRADRYRRVRP